MERRWGGDGAWYALHDVRGNSRNGSPRIEVRTGTPFRRHALEHASHESGHPSGPHRVSASTLPSRKLRSGSPRGRTPRISPPAFRAPGAGTCLPPVLPPWQETPGEPAIRGCEARDPPGDGFADRGPGEADRQPAPRGEDRPGRARARLVGEGRVGILEGGGTRPTSSGAKPWAQSAGGSDPLHAG